MVIEFHERAEARARRVVMVNPTATDAARRICADLGRRPGSLTVHDRPGNPFPVAVTLAPSPLDRRMGLGVGTPLARLAAQPPTDTLAERLEDALADLHRQGWWPVSLGPACLARGVRADAVSPRLGPAPAAEGRPFLRDEGEESPFEIPPRRAANA